MKVTGICMAKNEADIIEYTVGHMLTQVDEVIVADNLSTDGTGDLARDAGAIVVLDDDPAYFQAKKMTKLAHLAGEQGADWIVPFDADEAWIPLQNYPNIKRVLADIRPDFRVLSASYYNFRSTPKDDPSEENPLLRMLWRESAPIYKKVCCRYSQDLKIEQGNHYVRYADIRFPELPEFIVIRHYPYRSEQQFIDKMLNGKAVYDLTDLPEEMGDHWRRYGELLESNISEAREAYNTNGFFDPDTTFWAVFDPWPL